MAKLNELFKTFLSDIEPDEAAVGYAQDAHTSVRECLEQDNEFSQYIEDSFLYGSYKRHTAVGDIKDVDIVVLTNFDTEDEENDPRSILRKLKAALARCYDDSENPQYQRRSIRIDDPLPDNEDVEMTLDIIPAVVTTNDKERLKVPDRDVQEWIWSHPKGHLKYSTELNDQNYSGEQYVPLVKIMKWWWKYQCEVIQPEVERPKPKGFWVECLMGENFDPEQEEWADHFIAVLTRVADKYSNATDVPELDDPGLPGEKIRTNMQIEEFEVFMNAVDESLSLAMTARDTDDKLESSKLWREIFGEMFPLYDEEETEKSRSEARQFHLADTSHAAPLCWPENYDRRFKVRLDAYLYVGDKRLGGINSDGRVLPNGLSIKYVAKARAGSDCEILWQVVNTGKHAESDDGLRGTYFEGKTLAGKPSYDPKINWEATRYTGKHWIECFVVKDGKCVGRSGRFYVTIRNPEFPRE